MNLPTNNPFFTHGIDKLCTICHTILKDTNSSRSIFSTLEELESPGPVNVLQVLQSFSNFNFYNGKQMVCTTCYDKTIDVYKFIQMCNKAHDNMQHYLENVEAIATIKVETDVDVKVEEISIEPARVIIDERKFVEEMKNEEISKFDELRMFVSSTEIKIEEIIEEEETSNYEEITISHTEIVPEEETDNTAFNNLIVEKINEQMHDERMGFIKCNDCDFVCRDKNELGDHRKDAKHSKYNLRRHDQRHISKDLTTKSRLSTLIRVHGGEKPLTSLVCKRGFAGPSSLGMHTDTHNDVKVKLHKCKQCDRRFSRAANLRRHMDIHNGVKAHKCEQCGRRFTQAVSLSRHMDIHNGIKAHKCEHCDRRFTRESNLRRHMDSHTNVKAYKCEQCNLQLRYESNLRRHMNKHNCVKAAKVHKCEVCDRRFANASNLRKHMDIHNGVKAHQCEQCGRRFTHPSGLRSHVLIHNGIKPYKCEQCDRRFTRATHLRRHMNIHT